jgi:hypothetical protein
MRPMRAAALLTIAALSLILSFNSVPALAQASQDPAAKPAPSVKPSAPSRAPVPLVKADAPIKIDGVLDEPIWQKAAKLDIGYEWMPGENVAPPVKSEVLVTFDDARIYIAFRCLDPEPGAIRAHLMDRDATDTLIQDDHVTFQLDTFNDERRAYQFRVNPLGVQADAIFSELEGFEDFSWDAIWESAGLINDAGYAIEVAIPFNQLRFPAGRAAQTWGFEADRSYPRNVRHRISTHPRDRNINTLLGQANKISGFEGVSPGMNLQITPTLTVDRTDSRPDFPAGGMVNGAAKADPGLTARWGLTPNLTLNAALNPDFSQIEADAAQLDVNTRFALYYPEKRPFFLEAADFFLTPFQAVFTRSVADPLWGGKVTGKIGRGAMGFFAAEDRINNLVFPSNQGSWGATLNENVTSGVFRYRYDVGSGSTIGALYAGRVGNDYHNHNAGIDGFLRLGPKDQVVFQLLRSDTRYPDEMAVQQSQPLGRFGGNAISAGYTHMSRSLWLFANYESIDAGFRADSGFMPRVDTRLFSLGADFFVYGVRGGGSSGKWFDRIDFRLQAFRIEDHTGRMTDAKVWLGAIYMGPFQTQATILARFNQEYYSGTTYDTSDVLAQVMTKPAGGLSFGLMANAGRAIDYTNVRPATALRFGPQAELGLGRRINLNLSYSLERLAHEGSRIYTANLLQGRLIYNFDTRIFLRAIVQYRDVDREPAMYVSPVDGSARGVFTQFLFSYKLNSQTVVFLGYSDNSLGARSVDFVRADRTLFFKIGYAWVM